MLTPLFELPTPALSNGRHELSWRRYGHTTEVRCFGRFVLLLPFVVGRVEVGRMVCRHMAMRLSAFGRSTSIQHGDPIVRLRIDKRSLAPGAGRLTPILGA